MIGPRKFVHFILIAFAVLPLCCTALAQANQSNPSEVNENSLSGLTGAGAGRVGTTAAKLGGADGQGNSMLGGNRRPLYRLQPSDVVEISFTLAPEFNQTLTVQPDGYVTLKDAGMVAAQGLSLAEFSEAVKTASRVICTIRKWQLR